VLAGSYIGFVGVSFAFGLSLLAMVYTIGPISGCHINPAVTLGVLLAKRIGARDAAMYVVAQIFGAIAASALVLLVAAGARVATTSPPAALARMALGCTHREGIQCRPRSSRK
jgi:aquaporin Z